MIRAKDNDPLPELDARIHGARHMSRVEIAGMRDDEPDGSPTMGGRCEVSIEEPL